MTFNGSMKEGVAKGVHIPGPVILSKLSSLLGLFIHLQSVLKHTVTEGSGLGPQILKGYANVLGSLWVSSVPQVVRFKVGKWRNIL